MTPGREIIPTVFHHALTPETVHAWLKGEASHVQWIDREHASGLAAPLSILLWNPIQIITAKEFTDGSTLLKKLVPGQGPRHPWSGWYGGFTFEWGTRQVDPSIPVQLPEGVPAYWLGYYTHALVFDHRSGVWSLYTPDLAWKKRLERFMAAATSEPLPATSFAGIPFTALVSTEKYREQIDWIQERIRAGDFYQVNYTVPFHGTPAQDSAALYRILRRLSPTPYAGLFTMGSCDLLCFSPELLFQVSGATVVSCPIKGTAPRHEDPQQDLIQRQTLKENVKDCAELLMIVDLVRNDLGQVCRPGSIQVPRLYDCQSFATVHHLVATVSGELALGAGAREAFLSLFPGGSISGAPKRAALQAIHTLEDAPRGFYTGSLGYFLDSGDAEWNIAIRTLQSMQGELIVHSGGGIVIDSHPEAEYRELLDKIGFVFSGAARRAGLPLDRAGHLSQHAAHG